jgi:hypothetical protein
MSQFQTILNEEKKKKACNRFQDKRREKEEKQEFSEKMEKKEKKVI